MKSIKITERAESKVIDSIRQEEGDVVSVKSFEKAKTEEKEYYEDLRDRKDAKYHVRFNFPSKYYYFVFLMMFQNSNEMLPLTVRHVLTLSGG